MPAKIEDEFSHLDTDGRRYRFRNRKKGLCARCTTPSEKFLCEAHRDKLNSLKRQIRKEGGHLPRVTRLILNSLGT